MISKEIVADSLTSIVASSGVKVIYTQASDTRIRVTAPEDMMPYLRTDVNRTTLKCGMKSSPFCDNNRVEIRVSAPAITDFTVSSSASILVPATVALASSKVDLTMSSSGIISISQIYCDSFDVTASSSALLKSNVTCRVADISVSSSGVVNIEGLANTVDFAASSSGYIGASKLIAAEGSAAASSSGVIDCNIESPTGMRGSSSGVVNNEYTK